MIVESLGYSLWGWTKVYVQFLAFIAHSSFFQQQQNSWQKWNICWCAGRWWQNPLGIDVATMPPAWKCRMRTAGALFFPFRRRCQPWVTWEGWSVHGDFKKTVVSTRFQRRSAMTMMMKGYMTMMRRLTRSCHEQSGWLRQQQTDGQLLVWCTNGMIAHHLGATVLYATLTYSVIRLVISAVILTEACPVVYLQPHNLRKLIHTLSAPLFMLVWPLFSNATKAWWFAVIVALLNAVHLWLAGWEW